MDIHCSVGSYHLVSCSVFLARESESVCTLYSAHYTCGDLANSMHQGHLSRGCRAVISSVLCSCVLIHLPRIDITACYISTMDSQKVDGRVRVEPFTMVWRKPMVSHSFSVSRKDIKVFPMRIFRIDRNLRREQR